MRSLLFILFIALFPLSTLAQESNAGFVKGLWYSQEKVFADTPIRIYAAIRNNTGSDLSGTVDFLDNDKRIDKKNVQALDGRIIESWADWTPLYGTHTVSANLGRIELSRVGSTTQTVEVTSALAKDTFFVDRDTDGDSIGNKSDSDDDGDGQSDVQEASAGTNPLVKDAPIAEKKASEEETKKEEVKEKETAVSVKEDTSGNGTNEREGLEQYLTESPAENVLSGVTSFITTAKENVDTYRQDRKKAEVAKAAADLKVNKDGFGEIQRSTGTAETAQPKGTAHNFFGNVAMFAGKLFNAIFTGILFALSFILGHPMFVQLGILLLILFLILRFAAKFGRRPVHKKFK